MLGLSANLSAASASMRKYIKDNLKLYLDFKKNRSDELKFTSEGSTSFNGSSDYINCGASNSIASGTNFTLACWFKNTDTDDSKLMQLKRGATSSNLSLDVNVGGSAGHVGAVVRHSSGGTTVSADGSVDDGAWHHLALTTTSSAQVLYLDGVSIATGTVALVDEFSTDPFTIGGQDGSSYGFGGSMANVGVWTRVLSIEEINSVMNKSYIQLGSVEKTSLVIWQSLDSNASSGVHNSGYANSHVAETLGTELVKSDLDGDDWLDHGTNQVTVDNGVFTITRGNSDYGSRARFLSSGVLTATTVNTKIYKASWTSYITGSGTASVPFSFHTSHYDHALPVNTTSPQNYEVYFIGGGTGSQQIQFNTPSNATTVVVSNFSVKEVTSAGWGVQKFPASTGTSSANELATTTSVYGGKAPVLPRAIDISESQAEQIGNGSLTTSSGGYVDLGNDSTLQFDGSFSVGCWFKTTDATASNEIIMSANNDGVNDGWLLRLNSSRKLEFGVLLGAITDGGSASNDGEWHHVVGVHESGVGNKLYKNGILVASNTTGTDLSNHVPNFHIGNQDYSTPRALDGSYAQAFAYEGVLTQAQVQEVVESTSYSKIPANIKTNIRGYWALDTDNSVKAVDFTSGTVGSTTPITAFGTNSFSISTWVKASGSYQSVFMTDTSQVDNCLILTVNMGTKIGIGDNNSWHHLTADAAGTVANKWHLITYVREGTGTNESKFYVDGALKHTDTNNINLLSADGWKLGLGSYGYTGQIKELAVFHNKALTATEVLAQYNNGIENNFTTSGMTHHWVLNNATTITDLVGGNNGTGSSVTLVDAVALDSTNNNNDGSLN